MDQRTFSVLLIIWLLFNQIQKFMIKRETTVLTLKGVNWHNPFHINTQPWLHTPYKHS